MIIAGLIRDASGHDATTGRGTPQAPAFVTGQASSP
jgi:hypothetical protein